MIPLCITVINIIPLIHKDIMLRKKARKLIGKRKLGQGKKAVSHTTIRPEKLTELPYKAYAFASGEGTL